jgi:serine/threonine protein kinase
MAVKVASPRQSRIGEYEVISRLAQSDLSSTFKARHPTTGEVVAIKVAGPTIAQDLVLSKRFEQEYTLTRNLDHPHLVRALHFGYDGDRRYIVLEYVPGTSLGALLEEVGRLREADAVRIIGQVGKALHYAHQHRVIHRNVKPDHILLAEDGTAKLADLGLAKDHEVEACLTRQCSGLGTPNFMAPEQFNDAKNADRRCDVYSLAATLYMAVTGDLPFQSRGLMGILRKKLENTLVPPRQLVPELSTHLEAAVMRALDVNPRVRHASCQEFLDELDGKVAPARPISNGRAERRAKVRFPSQLTGVCQPLQSRKGGRWDVVLQDVSGDGLAMVLCRRFELRTVLLLELNSTANQPCRRMLVRVVRIQSLPASSWLLGCDFGIRLSDEEVKTLL